MPSFVGGDIGSGILSYPIPIKHRHLEKLESVIRRVIHVGGGHNHIHGQVPVEESYISRLLSRASSDLQFLAPANDTAPTLSGKT